MWTRTLALIALAPALAFAKTSVTGAPREASAGTPIETDSRVAPIVIGEAGADVELSKLRVIVDGGEIPTVRLVLTLATDSNERRHAVIPLALPDTARITGGSIVLGVSAPMVAKALLPTAARAAYQELFQLGRDPLLVEQVTDATEAPAPATAANATNARPLDAFAPVPPRANDHLRTPFGSATRPTCVGLVDHAGVTNYVVRAFPLARSAAARVELIVELASPDATRLVIAHARRIGRVEVQTAYAGGSPPPAIRVRHDTHAPISVALPPARALPVGVAAVAERPRVDAAHSLFAGWAREGTPPRITFGSPTHCCATSVDGREIRRAFKLYRSRLARCYSRFTEYRGGQEGTAVIHFAIHPSGSVVAAEVDGELEDRRITDCLAGEVRTWTFRRGDAMVMANYPLHFTLAE